MIFREQNRWVCGGNVDDIARTPSMIRIGNTAGGEAAGAVDGGAEPRGRRPRPHHAETMGRRPVVADVRGRVLRERRGRVGEGGVVRGEGVAWVGGGGEGLAGGVDEDLRPGDGDVHDAVDEHVLGAERKDGERGAELVVVALEFLPVFALEGVEPSPVAEEPVARNPGTIKR